MQNSEAHYKNILCLNNVLEYSWKKKLRKCVTLFLNSPAFIEFYTSFMITYHGLISK